jgi:hypothetical protein
MTDRQEASLKVTRELGFRQNVMKGLQNFQWANCAMCDAINAGSEIYPIEADDCGTPAGNCLAQFFFRSHPALPNALKEFLSIDLDCATWLRLEYILNRSFECPAGSS